MKSVMKKTTKQIIKFKKTENKFPVIKEIKERFSPRFFDNKPINNKTLNSIFEAARWAPSAYNFQPWYFYYAHQGSLPYNKILSCLSDRNRWAKTAPVFIVACYIKNREGEVNRFAEYDLGSAIMSMAIQAQSMGVYCRQMGLFDADQLQKLLNIDNEQKPFVVLALGKIGDYRKIDQELLEKEWQKRDRKENISKNL
jgi:nitroreductase